MATLLATLRVFNWRRFINLRWLFVAGAIFVALAAGGFLALKMLKPGAPAQIAPGQTLAWKIARSAMGSAGVQLASSAYVPGDGMVLYTRTDQTDRARIRTWALMQLEPFADQLAELPAKETLTWVIDFGPAPAEQEVLTAPLSRSSDPKLYRYVAAAPGMLGDAQVTVAPIAATAAPVAEAPASSNPVSAPAAAEPTAAPAGDSAPAQVATQPQVATDTLEPLLNTGFSEAEGGKSAWLPMSGDWVASDGIYSQRDTAGYDMISMLDTEPLSHYSMEAKLRLGEGEQGGGFVYNAPSKTTRNGAQVIDMADKGSFLRWGRYDEEGAYVYEGGATIDPPVSDGQWHDLKLVTQADSSVVSLDGRELGTIANTSPAGNVGLMTSITNVDFDDVRLTVLPENGDVPLPTAAPAATTAPAAETATGDSFGDDFADGDAKGWQVMSGTWQNVDGAYQQSDVSGSDMGSVSPFQTDSFTATVRVKRLDGDMGAGLYFNMAERDSKNRSQMINYTQSGTALQWGHFDEGGNFVFEGSAPVPDGGDGEWHTLNVQVLDGVAVFTLDGQEVAKDVPLAYKEGYLGLVVSNSKVAFDDVQFARQ